MVMGPISLQGEYIRTHLDRNSSSSVVLTDGTLTQPGRLPVNPENTIQAMEDLERLCLSSRSVTKVSELGNWV